MVAGRSVRYSAAGRNPTGKLTFEPDLSVGAAHSGWIGFASVFPAALGMAALIPVMLRSEP